MTSLTEHMIDHIKLGLDFRFPAEGNTYFKFSLTQVDLYIDGVLAFTWTKPV
jgi:hypothetical protein